MDTSNEWNSLPLLYAEKRGLIGVDFAIGALIYHDKYGIGRIIDSFNEDVSVVIFNNCPEAGGLPGEHNKIIEIKFETKKHRFEYTCPGCNKVAAFKGTIQKCLKWKKAIAGSLCPECLKKRNNS